METKTKLLIAVGAAFNANCQPCLKTIIKKALDNGADKKEIAETINGLKAWTQGTQRTQKTQGKRKDQENVEPLDEKTLSALGLNPSEFGEGARKLKIVEIAPPPSRKAGKIVQGDSPESKAKELAKLLHEEAKAI